MQVKIVLLVILCFYNNCPFSSVVEAQELITQPPESTTAALDTNVSFSCRGNGPVLWSISNAQIRDESQLSPFAMVGIYVPLPKYDFSELIITATLENNATRNISCIVDQGITGAFKMSEVVTLHVYAEPSPPTDLNINVDGLNLVATWSEPFSHEGEELVYVISITNTASGAQEEVTVNTTSYVLTEPLGERDCAEYQFTIFSSNDYSKSHNSIDGSRKIPTEPLIMKRSDVKIEVSFTSGVNVSATIIFNSSDPCPSYPVIKYTFNITDTSINTSVASISHNSTSPLTVNSDDDLLSNKIYELIIEADNNAGKTLSDKIVLYTSGLQSSIAAMELNGSITVTCIFATGASSTGCQVTIFVLDSLQELLSINITRPNGNSRVSMTLEVHHKINYDILLVQTVELLNGGDIGDIKFDQRIVRFFYSEWATSTRPSSGPSPTQAPSEFVIIVAVLCTVLVLLLLVIITVCAIVSLNARKKTHYLSSHDSHIHRQVPTVPEYESIELDPNTNIPATSVSEVVSPGPRTVISLVYDEVGQASERLQIQTSHTYDLAHDPTPCYSNILTELSMNQVQISSQSTPQPSSGAKMNIRERYEMQSLSTHNIHYQVHQEASDHESNLPGGEDKLNVPTDPITGYSTMLRPDKIKPATDQVPFYERIEMREECLQSKPDGDRAIARMNSPYSTLLHNSHPPISSHNTFCSSNPTPGGPSVLNSIPQDTLSPSPSTVLVVPTNPMTGYSTMLRPNKVVPPPGPVPLYMINDNVKDKKIAM